MHKLQKCDNAGVQKKHVVGPTNSGDFCQILE
jgi:hypothetical protein